jgi:hypothetical protein
VRAAAGAFADVLGAIHNHGNRPPILIG